MKQPPNGMKYSLRVGFGLWHDPTRRSQLIRMLGRHAKLISDVWLFTAYEHGVLHLDELSRRCSVLGEALTDFREVVDRAGINHLGTAGHGSERVCCPLDEPWEKLVGINGKSGGYCFSDPRFRNHIKDAYKLLCSADPDFIWIDDDVRMEARAGAGLCCFCSRCLEDFSRSTGTQWTREALIEAFNDSDEVAGIAIRRKWIHHNRTHIAGLLQAIRQAVDEVKPHLPLGLMTAELSYSGYGHGLWAQALAGSPDRLGDVMWRPGHGFYTDDRPRDLLEKSAGVGRQIRFLPAGLTDIQYEHESFPHQFLDKSQSLFAAECLAAAAVGCSGAALNCLPMSESDPLDEYEPRFELLASRKDALDIFLQARQGRRPSGIWLGMTGDHQAFLRPGGDWAKAPLMGSDMNYFQQMFSCGLSQTYLAEDASVVLLSQEGARELADDPLQRALSTGAFIDADALKTLISRGYGELLGFAPGEYLAEDSTERFCEDPINGSFAGWNRNCRKWFCGGGMQLLIPQTGAREISRLVDYCQEDRGTVSGVFENRLGGRVYISGYYPWIRLLSRAKFAQLRRIMQWLSHDSLDGWVESFHRTALWTYRSRDKCDLAVVMNVSLDEASDVQVLLRRPPEQIRLTNDAGESRSLDPSGQQGGYTRYILPRLGVWRNAILQDARGNASQTKQEKSR